MTNRLTPEALERLLADHAKCSCEICSSDARFSYCEAHNPIELVHFPCTIYLLASEVRDARPVIEALRRIEDGVDHPRGMSDQTAGFYEAVNWAQGIARSALAHYEEGTK